MRIGGLASGMDIDQMVKDLMKAERVPLDKLSQKKTQLEWQRDDYRSMNKLLNDLDQLIFEGIGKQGKFSTKSVSSTNSSVVSATANGDAANTTMAFDVTNTATSTTWVGSSKDLTSYKTVGDKTLSFTVIDGANKNQGVKTIDIKDGDSVDTIVSKFNSSGLGVTAFYDTQNKQFVLSKKDTGSKSSLVIDATTASFMSEIGFVNATGEVSGRTVGKDASFKINGYATTRATNTFEISGVTYTLQQAGTANISVASNTDATVDVIKSFVTKYNETIEAVNKKTSETKYRDYPPLTDEQRKDLSDKEAELWDEKAKSGMLKGDTILPSGLNTMRQNLYATVATGDAKYDQLSEIGITTSVNYLEKGKLEINEDKLRKALADNPDAVMKLFTGYTDSNKNEVKGIAKNLRDTIHNTIDKIEGKAGKATLTNSQFTLGRELTDVSSRISAFEDRLTQVENRYWRQFTEMEKAIQRSNSQATYLMQQFGGGQ
jgi:flagellar hook-associated protein 2